MDGGHEPSLNYCHSSLVDPKVVPSFSPPFRKSTEVFHNKDIIMTRVLLRLNMLITWESGLTGELCIPADLSHYSYELIKKHFLNIGEREE